jgi:transposase InsO family protein
LGTSTRHDHQPTKHTRPVTISARRRLRSRKSSDQARPRKSRACPRADCQRGARVRAVTSLELVRREFRRDAPDLLWMTGHHRAPHARGQGVLRHRPGRLPRFVGGWAIDSTQTTTLVLNALAMAIRRRTDQDGLVIHSDRGVQPGLKPVLARVVVDGELTDFAGAGLVTLTGPRGCRRGGSPGGGSGAARAARAVRTPPLPVLSGPRRGRPFPSSDWIGATTKS